VDAVAEGEVAIVGAPEVQSVGLGELRRIAIRRSEPELDKLSPAD
jgi:hypothetical protein